MVQDQAPKPKKTFWVRARPYLIMTAVILGLEFAVAYWLDWSIFHVNEIELSQLDDEGKCIRFSVNNLLQEERVLEEPTLSLMAVNSNSIARSRPIPLKLEGTDNDRILLQAGDRRKLCASFASDMLKRDIIYKIQSFDEPEQTRCKFSVLVRKPLRSHTHVYARVFNCVDQLQSLYE